MKLFVYAGGREVACISDYDEICRMALNHILSEYRDEKVTKDDNISVEIVCQKFVDDVEEQIY